MHPAQRDKLIESLHTHWGKLATAVALIAFIAWFASLAVANHAAWLTFGYDLGNADQALWNTAQGRPLQFTNWVGKDDWFLEPTRLAMHVEPIYLLLAPLYWLWEDVRGLLILQTVLVALGAVPAYALARRQLRSEGAGVVFALAYLLSIGVHWLVLGDFHAVSLAAPFLLFAFFFLIEARYLGFVVFALLAMMTKENIPLAVAGMGVWAWLVQGRRRLGQITLVVSLAWFLVAVFGIIPLFNKQGGSPFLEYYEQLPDGPQVAATALGHLLGPNAWRYFFNYLAPLIFLPVLSPLALLPALPDLAINLLSDNPAMNVFGRHYVAALIPIGIVAAVQGLARVWDWVAARWPERSSMIRTATLSLVLLSSLLFTRNFPVLPIWSQFQWPHSSTTTAKLPQFAALVPPDASICAQNRLNPHFSHRERLHLLPYTLDCEYVILHLPSALFLRDNIDGAQDLWYDKLVGSGTFGMVAAEDGLLLLQRGAPVQSLPESFFTYLVANGIAPHVERSGYFGDAIEFVGYDLAPRPGQPPILDLYFRAAQVMDEDFNLRVFLIEEPGKVIAATEHAQPNLVWYPTSRWKPGDVLTVTVNTFDWSWQLDPARRYALALAWDDGQDAWEPSTRLRYQDLGDAVAPRRQQGDTLVYLSSFRASGEAETTLRRASTSAAVTPLAASVGRGIRLAGYAWEAQGDGGKALAGEVAGLHLYWQVDEGQERDYTVFVHALDATGALVAQGDGAPVGGAWPVSRWSPGDLVDDYHAVTLPSSLPPGLYQVVVGMYDPGTGERVEVAGEGADATLRTVRLPQPLRVHQSGLPGSAS